MNNIKEKLRQVIQKTLEEEGYTVRLVDIEGFNNEHAGDKVIESISKLTIRAMK